MSRSLAERLSDLSTPRPPSFHPDLEDLEEETAAKVCAFDYDDGEEVPVVRSKLRRVLDEDPRYAGKAVSRKDLEEQFEGGPDFDVESESEESIEDGEAVDQSDLMKADQSDSSEGDDVTGSNQSDSEDQIRAPEGGEIASGFSAISLDSVQEDIAKGKAAKQQLGMWDGLLEGRIRLQKVLSLTNQIPQSDSLPQFRRAGGQQLEGTLRESQSALQALLDNLLELQRMLLTKNKETRKVLEGGSDNAESESQETQTGGSGDEDVPSDIEDESGVAKNSSGDAINSDQLEAVEEESAIRERLKRKRKKHHEWVLPNGERGYEEHIARVHKSFRPFQDDTITKWNSKTRLASGKIASKAFIQVDHSVLAQIQHVLNDRDRLVRRTQLKRSVYRILGKEEEEEEGGREGEGSRDAHLRDYDEEIFDDNDFYHQLLKELIERKMNFTETSDPIAMGRQWLELQKLRSKAKKVVDTKASKGRKIRYSVHPKLVSFMAPVQRGAMSDVSRNDLFASLFGGQQNEGGGR